MAVERSLAEFLDANFYSDPMFTRAERTDGHNAQFSGSDIIISIPSLGIENAVVDEKAQLAEKYIGQPLPTFALELSFILNYRNLIKGWFVDNDKATTHYLFMWINKAAQQKQPTADDFEEVEYALVEKNALHKYFISQGLTIPALEQKAMAIRNTGKNGSYDKGAKPYWFFYSSFLAERPVNIVVRKEVYIQLAIKHGIIKKK